MTEPVYSHDWISPYFPMWERMLKGYDFEYILEIGSYEGRSTIWFAEHWPKASILCIDTFKGSHEHEDAGIDFSGTEQRFRQNTNPYGDRIHVDVSTSVKALKFRVDGNNSFDLVLVDGSHTASDVLQDIVLSWLMLEAGGVMILDDYGWGGDRHPINTPKPAIDAFLACYAGAYRLLEKGYQVLVEKL